MLKGAFIMLPLSIAFLKFVIDGKDVDLRSFLTSNTLATSSFLKVDTLSFISWTSSKLMTENEKLLPPRLF